METLEWNKNIFGARCDIFRKEEIIGLIQWKNMFNGKAICEFRGKTYYIERDLLSSRLEIYDGKKQALLAKLTVNLFNPRSDVVVNGKRFELEMKNFWQSAWAWKFNGTEIISFTSNEFMVREKGEVELFSTCNDEVEILILLGLALRNQFTMVILLLVLIAAIIIL